MGHVYMRANVCVYAYASGFMYNEERQRYNII